MTVSKYKHVPLFYFLLYPLVFTMDYAYKGIVVSIGILLIYPILVMIYQYLPKKIDLACSLYILSFVGVLFGTVYVLFLASIDWRLYKEIGFIFPVNMSAAILFIGGFDKNGVSKERYPFVEALFLSFFVILFSFIQDIFLHSTLDLRFGDFGVLYTSLIDTEFSQAEYMLPIQIINVLPAQLKCLIFVVFAVMIGSVNINKKEE